MIYVILISIIMIISVVAIGMINAITGATNFIFKLPRIYILLSLLVLISGPIMAVLIYVQNFKLSFVPDALRVNTISYSKEESWGLGPGGNEAGIRIYPLPEEIAEIIKTRGMEFFKNLPENKNQRKRKWRGRYGVWHETPISENRYWKRNNGDILDIYDYICRYGFCIQIDKSVLDQAAEIINTKGNYYAYGRIGLIVVSPTKKVVIYMYNG